MSEPEGEVTFGSQIKAIRDRRGMGRKRTSRLTRPTPEEPPALTPTGLYRIENGSRVDPKVSSLIGLARALHIVITIDADGVMIEELSLPESHDQP